MQEEDLTENQAKMESPIEYLGDNYRYKKTRRYKQRLQQIAFSHPDLYPAVVRSDLDWDTYFKCGTTSFIRNGMMVWGPNCGMSWICDRCAGIQARRIAAMAHRKHYRKPTGKTLYFVTLVVPKGMDIQDSDSLLRSARKSLVTFIDDHRKPRSRKHPSWFISSLDLWWELTFQESYANPHFHGILHLEPGHEQEALDWFVDAWCKQVGAPGVLSLA